MNTEGIFAFYKLHQPLPPYMSSRTVRQRCQQARYQETKLIKARIQIFMIIISCIALILYSVESLHDHTGEQDLWLVSHIMLTPC